MFIYRLIYAFALTLAIIFYLVYTPWFSWFLLVFMLMLVPLDLLLSLPGMLTKSINIEAPAFLEQNAGGLLTITASHTCLPTPGFGMPGRSRDGGDGGDGGDDEGDGAGWDGRGGARYGRRMFDRVISFPVRCLYIKLRVVGDDFALQLNVLNAAGDGDRSEVEIDTSQTGLSVISVRRLYAVSLLGLFALNIKTNAKTSVLILPPPEKPRSTVELPRGLVLKPKPGGGFSEEHDVRGYLPGDPIKSMHWKLSAKLGMPIIREPLIPPQQSRLVHIMPWENAEERDSVLSHLRWVTGYLEKMGLKFYIRFGDRQLIEEISDEAGMIGYLRRVLDNSTVIRNMHYPRITRFSWVYKVSGEVAG